MLSHKQLPPDINLSELNVNLQVNPIYNLNVTDLKLVPIENPKSRYNFTPIDIITRITDEVNSGAIKILFVDFDQTFQIWNGAIPFGHPGTIRIFRQNGINIEVIE